MIDQSFCLDNGSSTKKANAGYNLSRYTGRVAPDDAAAVVGMAVQLWDHERHDHDSGRPQGDQQVGSQPRGPSVPFPFNADERPAQAGDQ